MNTNHFPIALGLVLLLASIGCAGQSTEPASATPTGDVVDQPNAALQQPATVPGGGLVESTSPPPPTLPDMGAAPEIGNEVWVNSDVPLTLASQRGKVVLLEFWTFGCINCQRVIPHVRKWHSNHAAEGLQVISIHYPEFAHERELANVQEATERFEIEYPVALDNDGLTWRAYRQRYWPTTYLIDKAGRIRYKHIGEYNERSAADAERAIESLLAEPGPGA